MVATAPVSASTPSKSPTTPRQGKAGVALVTGGVRGIGRAIAEELVLSDYMVIATYHSSASAAEAMRQQFEDEPLELIQCDVSKEDQVAELFKHIKETYGRLDVLINNAGINQDKSFHKMNTQQWLNVLDVNLNGAFYCCHQAIGMMRDQQYGRIVNISSIVGQKGNFGQANYAASKAGLLGLTKTLALENAKQGITVNALCPGFIETDMVTGIPDEIQTQIKATIPMGRFGTAEEVAKAVKYLISNDASYMTGQEISLNGGLLTH